MSPDDVWIDEAVLSRHPGYTAVVVLATGLDPGASTVHSERLLTDAEVVTVARIGDGHPHDLPEVAAWRDAFASFGVRPREARSSVEALMRRCASGVPRIDRLTDVYNAISLTHLVPVGGEDVAGYEGPARLVVADGTETFDTMADGEPVTQFAEPGEIVWRDDRGVTCRRWNWRQCVRTRLSQRTTEAIFIFDGLGPSAPERVSAAADDLVVQLLVDSPRAQFERRDF